MSHDDAGGDPQGHARARPRRTGSSRRREPAPATTRKREKLTPPCAGVHPADGDVCRYPLLKADRVCPRCGTPRPGADRETEGVKRETDQGA